MTRFIVTIVQHPRFGLQLIPCNAVHQKNFLNDVTRIDGSSYQEHPEIYSDAEGEIISICTSYSDRELTSRFGRPKEHVQDFLARITQEYINRHIKPFIDRKMDELYILLHTYDIPVYPYDRHNSLMITDAATVSKHPAEITFRFRKMSEKILYWQEIQINGKAFSLTGKNPVVLMNSPCRLLVEKQVIWFADPLESQKLTPFFSKTVVEIPARMEKQWFEKFLVKVAGKFPIESEGFIIEDINAHPTVVLYFELNWQRIPVMRPVFKYGNIRVLPGSLTLVFSQLAEVNGEYRVQRVIRNRDEENRCVELLIQKGLMEFEAHHYCIEDPDSGEPDKDLANYFTWIVTNARALSAGGISIDKSHFGNKYYIAPYTMQTEWKQEYDWFELRIVIHFNEFTIPLIHLRNHLLEGIREYILPDDTVFIIPAPWFSKYRDILVYGKADGEKLRVAVYHMGLLTEITNEDKVLAERIKDFLGGTKNCAVVPSLLRAKLRDYQLQGFQWLMHLRELGLNGCLADDMGLGKTVQTIALLCAVISDKEPLESGEHPHDSNPSGTQLSLFDSIDHPEMRSGHTPGQKHLKSCANPSLIIAPKTLIFNWKYELNKFAPHLKVTVYSGAHRHRVRERFNNSHIVLASYGIVRKDFQHLKETTFEYVVLDESQFIKNAASNTYKALLTLKSDYRLIMSGTPVENSLTDLYPQMHFLNRNILGSMRFFRKEFFRPCMQGKTEEDKHHAREKLLQIISPLIMRRTKDQVASELPPKTEQLVVCRMTHQQEIIYEEEKSKIRNYILEQISNHSLEKSSTVIINGLNRLRQIACHPAMVNPDLMDAGSGKLELVVQHIRTLIEKDHKILVISSYVKHLRLVSNRIKSLQINHVLLTGQTANSEEVVSRFMTDQSVNIMLMTLKKGGYGLNLTKADYVLVLDPWWNPASQQQGTDRVHRIGQNKPVFVYKYVTIGTVEEKILQMQREKKRIADSIVGVNNPLVSLLTRERLEELFGSR